MVTERERERASRGPSALHQAVATATLVTFVSLACSPAVGPSRVDAGRDARGGPPCSIERGIDGTTWHIDLTREATAFTLEIEGSVRGHRMRLRAEPSRGPVVEIRASSETSGTAMVELRHGGVTLWSVHSVDGRDVSATVDGQRVRADTIAGLRAAFETRSLRTGAGRPLLPSLPNLPAGWSAGLREIARMLHAPTERCSTRRSVDLDDPASLGAALSHPGVAAAFEDTRDTSACIGCVAACFGAWLACIGTFVGAVIACATTGPFVGLCVFFAALGFLGCATASAACFLGCDTRPGPCCPVPCGTTRCCLSGHTCSDPSAGSCCAGPAIAGPNLCCNAGETVFRPAAGTPQCCESGRDVCTNSASGAQLCCEAGGVCHPSGRQCCNPTAGGAATLPCGSDTGGAPLCCAGTSCNGAPAGVGFCCGGNVGEPGGACPAAAANMALQAPGCCTPGALCQNPGTGMARCCYAGDTPTSNGQCCPVGNENCGFGAECCPVGSCGLGCPNPTPTY